MLPLSQSAFPGTGGGGHNPGPDPLAAENRRAGQRTNVMLSASLERSGGVCDVRIRNLSCSGALIEGPQLPEVGASVCLTRGSLSIFATVVWRQAKQCGLRFSAAITVTDWVRPTRSLASSSPGQRQVDQIQADIRAGRMPISIGKSATAAPPPSVLGLHKRVAKELEHLRQSIDNVGSALAEDSFLVERHAASLQTFDRVEQVLGHLARLLASDHPLGVIEQISIQDLRTSLLGDPHERRIATV